MEFLNVDTIDFEALLYAEKPKITIKIIGRKKEINSLYRILPRILPVIDLLSDLKEYSDSLFTLDSFAFDFSFSNTGRILISCFIETHLL
jgi:hypothetical protein